MIFPICKQNYNRGYVALISVIMIGALGTAVMISVIASGINAGKTDLALQQSGIARVLASSCAEEALQKIVETGTTSSSGNLAIGSGTCSYLITSQSGLNITINSSGVLGTITKKVKVIISTTTPSLVLSSWQEVSDF